MPSRVPATIVIFTAVVLTSGCALGPGTVRATRHPYNEVIQQTTQEQLLLNLVRLQYREAPLFLEVGSIAAQFNFSQSASIDGTINEGIRYVSSNNPHQLKLGAGIGYEERPTITYAPLQGEDFVQRMLGPIALEKIVLLAHSGWNVDRVLRLTVQGMNGLDNAARASGPTPAQAPRYAEFAEASRLLRELQHNGLLQLGYEPQPVELSEPLPADRVTAENVLAAARDGYRFRADADGRVALVGTRPTLVWRVPEAAARTPALQQLIGKLRLDPTRDTYPVRVTTAGRHETDRREEPRPAVDVETRSLMGALFYLSQAVEVPEEHRRRNLVTTTLDEQGRPFDWTEVTGELLRVHCSVVPPRGAAVAVRYRGYWFYIDDQDLDSKSTFGLLGQLFALQAGGEVRTAPVLTLPIGG